MEDINRRDFIKGTVAAGLSLAFTKGLFQAG